MILAAPLVIPFAEAIGVSIAALGMAKATDKVNEFIQENPEQSIKIFQMIMPSQGIANALKNKSSEGDEDLSEDMDEEVEVEKDTRSKKEIVLEEVARGRAGKGNFSSPDAVGPAVSITGNVKRGLRDAGKIRKGPDPNYDASKKFQGYKRFIRPKKADGGAIGIEVLFGPKVPAAPSQLVEESEIVLGYRGPGGYQGGSSSRSSSSSSSTNQGPAGGASAGGNYGGNRNPSQTYGGSVFSGGGGNQNAKPPKTKTPNFVNNLKNVYGIVSPFINPTSNIGKVKTIFDTYNLYKNRPFIEKDMTLGMTPQVPTNMQVAELSQKQLDFLNSPKIQRDLKEFGREPKAVFDMLPNYEERRPSILSPFKKQEPTTPEEYNQYLDSIGVARMTVADGGRVGFFMGGPALEGPALGIYNSMKAYQSFTDQEIANAIKEAGYELPTSSTPDPTPDPGQGAGQSGGRGSDQDAGYVDRQDYSFNKKNYRPGNQLEINPAAFGVSFPDQPSSPKREGIINQAIDSFTSLPTRSLSSFASPTTGGNIVGPAEQGFMGQTLDIDPAGRTREEIRSIYDNYNRFTGRTSNFADARQKGKAGEVLGTILGFASGIPFLGPLAMLSNAFGPQGDKSLQSKYTVDGAGFGNTGARDEFGLATFDKKDGFLGLTGNTTRDYTNRISERLGELKGFFADRGIDINDPDAYDDMKDINGFYAKQVQAYQQRLATENINTRTRDAIEAQRIQKERLDDIKIEAANREAVREAAKQEAARKSAIDQEAANREAVREAAKQEAARKSAIDQEKANRDAVREAAKQEAARKSAIDQEKANRDAVREAAKQEAARKSAIDQEKANRDAARRGGGGGNGGGGSGDKNSPGGGGSYCFDPSTPIQMADGSTKQIKNIQLGDDTKGGEVTGVFQFKASDEIHDYKGVTVAGSHFVKEDGRFIMVKDSPLSVKIDKIPVVYSLDTSDRRIFINDIEFADYNGDGVAKNFLTNAGVDLTGFDTEVLRQVENRLI
jgi:hypothetical protein